MFEKIRLQSALLVSLFEILGGTFKAAWSSRQLVASTAETSPSFEKLQGIHKFLGFILDLLVSF